MLCPSHHPLLVQAHGASRESEVISQAALGISASLSPSHVMGHLVTLSSDFHVPQRCPVSVWMNGALGYRVSQMPVSPRNAPEGRARPLPVLCAVLAPIQEPQLLGVREAETR